MKKGTWTRIVVDDKTIEAQFIGRGRFAQAYRHKDTVYLFIRGCFMKEALALFIPTLPHLPIIKQHESQAGDNGNDTQVYSMPFYTPLRASHTQAWAQYRALEKANDDARTEILEFGKFPKTTNKRIGTHGYEVNQKMIELAKVPQELKEALSALAYGISNYGSGCVFEFAPRNLGVDENERLILRDVCYDTETIGRKR